MEIKRRLWKRLREVHDSTMNCLKLREIMIEGRRKSNKSYINYRLKNRRMS